MTVLLTIVAGFRHKEWSSVKSGGWEKDRSVCITSLRVLSMANRLPARLLEFGTILPHA